MSCYVLFYFQFRLLFLCPSQIFRAHHRFSVRWDPVSSALLRMRAAITLRLESRLVTFTKIWLAYQEHEMSGRLLRLNQGAYNCFSRSPLGMSDRNISYLIPMAKPVLKETKPEHRLVPFIVMRIASLARFAIYSRRVMENYKKFFYNFCWMGFNIIILAICIFSGVIIWVSVKHPERFNFCCH